MGPFANRTDEELLALTATEPAAFGAFYERHERSITGFFYARVGQADVAADLTAETFAAALLASRRFRPGPSPAVAWLFGIAKHVLGRSARRRRVEARARRRLAMPRLELDDDALATLDRAHAATTVAGVLERLAPEQREAVRSRVIDEEDYAQIAGRLGVSEAVVRKRVSRGISVLRQEITDADA